MGVAALRPDDLDKIAEAAEMAKLREALAQQQKAEEHEHQASSWSCASRPTTALTAVGRSTMASPAGPRCCRVGEAGLSLL